MFQLFWANSFVTKARQAWFWHHIQGRVDLTDPKETPYGPPIHLGFELE